MHFRHGSREEPEINLIPFIDVLLVVLIFLMLSTTYSKFTEMQLRCRWPTPTRSATTPRKSSSPYQRRPLFDQQDASCRTAASRRSRRAGGGGQRRQGQRRDHQRRRQRRPPVRHHRDGSGAPRRA